MNKIKLVWNKGSGGHIALEIPTQMGGGALQEWVYKNAGKIREGKKIMAERELDEYVLHEFPEIRYTPIAEVYPEDELRIFEKRIEVARSVGDSTIIITDDPKFDHDWNSGFVEYLIDRYEYTQMGGYLTIHLNHKRDV
jgi:hypothetical protein